jgi:hypothetical protein
MLAARATFPEMNRTPLVARLWDMILDFRSNPKWLILFDETNGE